MTDLAPPNRPQGHDAATGYAGLAARLQEPRLYVMTYSLPWKRWLPIRIRHTYEKVCSWDEALALEAQLRAMGVANVEVRHG